MPGVVAFRDELPYSPTGKLLRRVLRDELSGRRVRVRVEPEQTHRDRVPPVSPRLKSPS